jgi:hypothetical protein
VTLLGVMLGAAAGLACCFTSCAGAACVHAIATANAPAVTNAVRIGLMSFLPGWICVSRCSRWNGQFFLLLLPNVILAPEPVKADRERERRDTGVGRRGPPQFQD